MSLKRDRSHHYGFTNIDYRTKQDKSALFFFQPWHNSKNFGTMGNSNYLIPEDKKKNILKISSNINKLKNLSTGIPNPKTYETCKFYNKNKIQINLKKEFFNERIAQLDESLIGKEIFNGDSMMIGELIKKRRNLKLEKNRNNKKKKSASAENIFNANFDLLNNNNKEKDKKEINENQNKNENKNKKKNLIENKIDLNKVKTIRDLLRKRYSVKSDYFNIYKTWNECSGKEINLIQAHNIINKLGININYNETKALIASVNDRGTDNMNINEFFRLIFNENPEFNIDKKNIEYKDEEYYEKINKNKSYDKLNLISKSKCSTKERNDDIYFLEEFLRLKLPKLSRNFHDKGVDESNINYNTFINSLHCFLIPKRYFDNEIIKGFIEKFPNDNNKENFDFKKYCKYCISKTLHSNYSNNKNENNDFFNLKDRDINILEKKLVKSKSQIYENKLKLKEYEQQKKEYVDSIKKEINEKKIKKDWIDINKNYNFPKENEINSMQPSKEYFEKIYSNKDEYKRKIDEIEKSYILLPSLTNNLKLKSRRNNLNPFYKNTFNISQPEINSSLYIDEKKRFNCNNLNDKIDFINKEKNDKKNKSDIKIKNILFYQSVFEKNSRNFDLKNELKNSIEYANKIKRIYDYEIKNQINNQLLE